MKKWGLFVEGELMVEYPFTNDGYKEALEDAKLVFEESGVPHEVKIFEE
jgi:hypothetical protein